ncbi:hypothetical protein ACWDA3_61640 [Nonomuraea rubra]
MAWVLMSGAALVILAVLVLVCVSVLRQDPQESSFARLIRLLSLLLDRQEPPARRLDNPERDGRVTAAPSTPPAGR